MEGIKVYVLRITMAKVDNGHRMADESHFTNDHVMVTECH